MVMMRIKMKNLLFFVVGLIAFNKAQGMQVRRAEEEVKIVKKMWEEKNKLKQLTRLMNDQIPNIQTSNRSPKQKNDAIDSANAIYQDQIKEIIKNILFIQNPLITSHATDYFIKKRTPYLCALMWRAAQEENDPRTKQAQKDLLALLFNAKQTSSWTPYIASLGIGAGSGALAYQYFPEPYKKHAAAAGAIGGTLLTKAGHWYYSRSTSARRASEYIQNSDYRSYLRNNGLTDDSAEGLKSIIEKLFEKPEYQKFYIDCYHLKKINELVAMLYKSAFADPNYGRKMRRAWKSAIDDINANSFLFTCTLLNVISHKNKPTWGRLQKNCELDPSKERGDFPLHEYLTIDNLLKILTWLHTQENNQFIIEINEALILDVMKLPECAAAAE